MTNISLSSLGTCLLAVILNLTAFGQKMDNVLSQTIRYPKEARDNKIEEIVYVSLDIDEKGAMRSYEILQSPNYILAEEVNRSFDLIQKTWKNKILEDRRFDQKYLVILEFNLNADNSKVHAIFDQTKKAISSGKNEEALYLLEQCIRLNPYNQLYFSTRSNLYRDLGKIEESQLDLLRSRKLKNELLSHLIISGYSL